MSLGRVRFCQIIHRAYGWFRTQHSRGPTSNSTPLGLMHATPCHATVEIGPPPGHPLPRVFFAAGSSGRLAAAPRSMKKWPSCKGRARNSTVVFAWQALGCRAPAPTQPPLIRQWPSAGSSCRAMTSLRRASWKRVPPEALFHDSPCSSISSSFHHSSSSLHLVPALHFLGLTWISFSCLGARRVLVDPGSFCRPQ